MRFIEKFTFYGGRNRSQRKSTSFSKVGAVIVLFFSIQLNAAASGPASSSDERSCDTVSIYSRSVLFPKASHVLSRDFGDNGDRLDSIVSFLSSAQSGDLLSVKVAGSYSPEGEYSYNTDLAYARARALADFVKKVNPALNPSSTVVHPQSSLVADYPQLRSAELRILFRNNTVSGDSVGEGIRNMDIIRCDKGDESDLSGAGKGETSAEITTDSICVAESDSICRQECGGSSGQQSGRGFFRRMFVTTNMLYDAAMTPNIGLGIKIADRFTVQADWMFARWNNREKRRYWRIYGGDLEVRYRVGRNIKGSPLGGHYIGVYGSLACYDFQAGRRHTGILSDKYNYAVVLSYTYSLPISRHLNIDFNLGVGYLWGRYKKHIPIDDCDVWLSTHKLDWVGPTRIGVTLVWLAGGSVKNNRKGGDQ